MEKINFKTVVEDGIKEKIISVPVVKPPKNRHWKIRRL